MLGGDVDPRDSDRLLMRVQGHLTSDRKKPSHIGREPVAVVSRVGESWIEGRQ